MSKIKLNLYVPDGSPTYQPIEIDTSSTSGAVKQQISSITADRDYYRNKWEHEKNLATLSASEKEKDLRTKLESYEAIAKDSQLEIDGLVKSLFQLEVEKDDLAEELKKAKTSGNPAKEAELNNKIKLLEAKEKAAREQKEENARNVSEFLKRVGLHKDHGGPLNKKINFKDVDDLLAGKTVYQWVKGKPVENWKGIDVGFTDDVVAEWQAKGFNFAAASAWVKICADKKITPKHCDFIAWLIVKERVSLESWIKKTGEEKDTLLAKWDAEVKVSETYVDGKEWKNISADFDTKEKVKQWKKESFTYEQTKDWISIGLKQTDYKFAAWIRSSKFLTPEQVLNTGDLVALRNEFNTPAKPKSALMITKVEFDETFKVNPDPDNDRRQIILTFSAKTYSNATSGDAIATFDNSAEKMIIKFVPNSRPWNKPELDTLQEKYETWKAALDGYIGKIAEIEVGQIVDTGYDSATKTITLGYKSQAELIKPKPKPAVKAKDSSITFKVDEIKIADTSSPKEVSSNRLITFTFQGKPTTNKLPADKIPNTAEKLTLYFFNIDDAKDVAEKARFEAVSKQLAGYAKGDEVVIDILDPAEVNYEDATKTIDVYYEGIGVIQGGTINKALYDDVKALGNSIRERFEDPYKAWFGDNIEQDYNQKAIADSHINTGKRGGGYWERWLASITDKNGTTNETSFGSVANDLLGAMSAFMYEKLLAGYRDGTLSGGNIEKRHITAYITKYNTSIEQTYWNNRDVFKISDRTPKEIYDSLS